MKQNKKMKLILKKGFSSLPNFKEEILNKLNLNLNNVNETHKILDGKIKYKFNNYINYPNLSVDDLDKIRIGDANNWDFNWKSDIRILIDYELEEECIYSLGIVGISFDYENNNFKFVTYGPHILVTNEIDIESLITYIEGRILTKVISLESDQILKRNDSNNIENNNCVISIKDEIIKDENVEDSEFLFMEDGFVIQFKYRKILISKEVHKSVSKIKYSDKLKVKKIDFKKSEELIKINNNKNLIKYLNVIPLNSKFGKIINNNYKSNDGKKGVLYKYYSNINIFIYNQENDFYYGIVYKNGNEYFKFKDNIVNNNEYDLIREIGNNKIFIKDNTIKFMETKIISKLIEQKKRAIINDNKIITADIECYLDENNKNKINKENDYKFIPYSCMWYTKKENKCYISMEFNSWEDMIEKCIEDLQIKFNKYTIYFHNLSNFDGIFLLKILYKKYKTKILFKDEKSISINISDKKDNNKKIKKKILLI
jgi:hypothetical protein